MATEEGHGSEKAPGTNIRQAGSVLSAAWSELLALAREAGSRKAGETVLQALTPAQEGAPSSVIEVLIESYRQYLGELANALPAIGRYLAAQSKPEAQSVARLLLQLKPEDLKLPTDNWRPSARQSEKAGEAGRLYTTKVTIDAFREAAEEKLKLGHAPLGKLLSELADILRAIGRINLARVLDEAKYDFRRRGFIVLSDIRRELEKLLDWKLEQYYATLDAFTETIGERVTQRILAEDLLEQYASAEQGADGWMPDKILAYLQGRFQAIGIQLSDRISAVAGRHDGVILDHKNDVVYEVRYFDDRFDVYGTHEGRRYKVGTGGEILLPVRVMDASQGLVVWSIDKRIVQEQLDVSRTRLEAWDTGAGRTPVILSVADHREGDLGAYTEITLGCLAAPPGNPLAVGMWMLCQTPVGSAYACLASQTIWGFDKIDSDIDVRYRANSATWQLWVKDDRAKKDPLLELTLPRGGEASSTSVPMLLYTTKPPYAQGFISLYRTLVIRNGRGEQLRGGGAGVSLSVTGSEPGTICDMLRRLKLVNDAGERARTPIFSVWTEHASGEAGAPSLVVVPPEST